MGRIFKTLPKSNNQLMFYDFVFCTGNIYLNCSHESIFFLELFESGFMFRSMTNPELTLCMAWDENQNTFSSMKTYKVVPAMSEEPLPKIALGTFEKSVKQQTYMGLASRLYSVPLFYLSMPRPIPLPWLLCIINFETR